MLSYLYWRKAPDGTTRCLPILEPTLDEIRLAACELAGAPSTTTVADLETNWHVKLILMPNWKARELGLCS
ncbi:MAG TPA: hypothetical protein V6C97_27590, partial [Oculatellaceae cyanobacterium]